MNQNNHKTRINFSTEIQIAEDNYWVVVTMEDKFDGTLDYKTGESRSLPFIVKIPVNDLVSAKICKDFIHTDLLKWQSSRTYPQPTR